jgi:phosphate transport system ATP-binding protein
VAEPRARIETDKLTAMYGKTTAVKSVSLSFVSNQVHALIGPSGCGKSTFLRTLNRMHELVEGGWITGRVLLDGQDIYDASINAMQLRRKVGMVFQRPTPFPTMSIYGNVAAGLRLNGRLSHGKLDEIVERSLRQAALWDEVKDRLKANAMALSGGQQQRLCVARTIAPSPDVVLLDEPTASLDPQGTQRIEELLFELKRDYTIIIVTHNMQQAARVSDTTTFFYLGTMVESGPTRQIFTAPRNDQTEAYITGRFG